MHLNQQKETIKMNFKTKVKLTSKGSLRIWIENQQFLNKAKFFPSALYTMDIFPDAIILDLVDQDRSSIMPNVTRRVTCSTRNGKERGIIDIHQKNLPFVAGSIVECVSNGSSIVIQEVTA